MTFKQKNKYLLIGAFCAGLLIYFFAINKTIQLRQQVKTIETELEQAVNSTGQMEALQRKVNTMDSKLKRYISDSDQNQEHVLDLISHFCSSHQLYLKDFPHANTFTQNDIELETIQFTVEGRYVNLLKLVYYLEQEARTGRITGVKFYSETNYRTMKKQVLATIFLQYIRKRR